MEESNTKLLGTGRLAVLAIVTALISSMGLPILSAIAGEIGIGENIGFWTTGVLSLSLIVFLMPKKGMWQYGWCRSLNKGNWKFLIPIMLLGAFNIPYLFWTSGYNPVLVALFTAGFIGFAEELAFRGYLYRALEIKLGEGKAIVISAVAFGSFHLINLTHAPVQDVLLQVLYAFCIGMAFAVVRAKTKSLLWPVIAHAALNFVYELTADDLTVFWLDTIFAVYCAALAVIYWICYVKDKKREA